MITRELTHRFFSLQAVLSWLRVVRATSVGEKNSRDSLTIRWGSVIIQNADAYRWRLLKYIAARKKTLSSVDLHN